MHFRPTVACGMSEQYVLTFHQISGSSPSAAIFLYNPNSVSVKYNLTTPNLASGGVSYLNQALNSNAGTSVSLSSSLLLDGSGSDTNRGEDIVIFCRLSKAPIQFCVIDLAAHSVKPSVKPATCSVIA
jgi:hypothetical protein